ncbi:MAG: TonB-dependent receptor [Pseudomonadota bacterium]
MNRVSSTWRIKAILPFAVSLTLSGQALAQSLPDIQSSVDSGRVLEEVIVRAMKRDQTIYEVPISMTAMSEADLQALGSQDLNDYAGFVPNLTVTSLGGRKRSSISIRGLSAQRGVASTVGVFVDEFNVSPTSVNAFNNPSLQDAAQVEILRGPQGVYFGRSVMAGAISVTTNKPSEEFEGEVSGRIGSNDRYLARGAVSGPLIEDTLAYRLVGYYEEFGGFLDNIGPSDAADNFDEYGFRLALRWTPSEFTTIDFSGTYSDAQENLPNRVPLGVWSARYEEDIPLLTFGGITSVDELAALQGTRFYPEVDHEVNFDDDYHVDTEAYYLMVRAEHEFDSFSLVGIAGYMQGDQQIDAGEADLNLNETPFVTSFGADAILFGDYRVFFDQEVESYTLELRAQSSGTGPLQWVIGALASQDEEVQTAEDYIKWGTAFDEPPPGFSGTFIGYDGPWDPGIDSDLIESQAVFGDLSYTFLDERLTLSAGARYSQDKFTSDGFEGAFALLSVGPEGPSALSDARVRPEASTSSSDISPALTAVYTFDDRLNVYAKAAKGYRAGGLNNSTLVPADYGPEEVWNYELGMKGLLLDGDLDLRLAVFRMDWEGVQVSEVDSVSLRSFTGNAGEARIAGAELETNWNFGENWLWQVGVGYTDAEYKDYDQGFVATEIGPVDLSGTRLPRAPEWTVNTQLQYNFTLASGADMYLRGEYQWTDDQFSQLGGRQYDAFMLDSFEFVNFRVGYTRGSYSLTAFAENIFDDIYLQGTTSGLNPLGIQGVVNEGRRFGVRGRYYF